jgi:hypothetical protein
VHVAPDRLHAKHLPPLVVTLWPGLDGIYRSRYCKSDCNNADLYDDGAIKRDDDVLVLVCIRGSACNARISLPHKNMRTSPIKHANCKYLLEHVQNFTSLSISWHIRRTQYTRYERGVIVFRLQPILALYMI